METSRKQANFRYMPMEFAQMQVTLIFRGTHTDPRINDRVDHRHLTSGVVVPGEVGIL